MPGRRILAGIGLALLVALVLWWKLSTPDLRQQAVYPSPDGKYRVILYSVPQRFAMPGQGSDAAGVVRLVDQSGKVLQETRVGLAREVLPPEWTPTAVRIPMITEWPLPQ